MADASTRTKLRTVERKPRVARPSLQLPVSRERPSLALTAVTLGAASIVRCSLARTEARLGDGAEVTEDILQLEWRNSASSVLIT